MTRRRRGVALLLTFMAMLVVSALALAVGVASQNSQVAGKSTLQDKEAYYIAEAGWQRARQALVAGTWSAAASPGSTYTETFGAGEYRLTIIDQGGGNYEISSEGYVPNQANYVARRNIAEYQAPVTLTNGTNYSLTAAASASSTNGGDVAANAKDGDSGTKWTAGVNGSGSWLKMDFSSAQSLNEIIVKEDNNITGVTIDWSDDNASWTTPSSLSVSNSGKTWTATFIPASHRYFRATFTASSSKKPSVKEMESYSTVVNTIGAGDVASQW